MPAENRFSQAAVFLGAAALGIVLLVIVPRQCQEKQATTSGNLIAPEPDSVESRRLQKPKSPAGTAPTQTKLVSGSSAIFQERAVQLSQKPLEEIGETLDDLMEKWVLTDPASAAAWVKQLPAGDFRESAGISLCQFWAEQDAAAAAQWVTANLGNGALQGALGAVAGVWAHRDPESVATWVASLPDPSDRQTGEASLAQTWGETNPAAAAVWLESLPQANQSIALQNLMLGWSVNDPAAAASWLQGATTNNPKLPVETVAVVVNAWSNQNAGDVSHWLNALPEGPFYESAATAFAQAAVEKSPKDALLWARSLGDPTHRQQSIIYAMETWMDQDHDGFVAALPAELEATADPALRKAIYDMLYRKDPGFKESLLKLAETPDTPAPPTRTLVPPTADQPAPSPVEANEP